MFQIRRWPPGYVLFAGFGGLLILMTAVGVDALRIMHQAETSNTEIRRIFLLRNHALGEIRAGIYVSGTWLETTCSRMPPPAPMRSAISFA